MNMFTNIFGGNATQTPNQPDPNQSATEQQPAGSAKLDEATPSVKPKEGAGTAPNGVVPDNKDESKSPLDQFSTLWETKPNESQSGEFKPEQLDPKKLQEVMSKVDMTSTISPDNIAKIQAGGEEATRAFIDSMNTVAQQTMMQSALVANKMVEQAVTKAVEATTANLPKLVKEQNLSNALQEQNPIYSNPAVKPVIDAVKTQLANKFPDATTTELTSMAQDFVKAMSTELNPAPKTSEDSNKSLEDWSSFLEMPLG